jgi:hypothetical protein
MKRIASIIALHCSLWHALLAVAGLILVYLTGVHISEALNTSALFTFFNTGHAVMTWEPSRGPVDHYLLEITDTHVLGISGGERNRLTVTRYETSVAPRFSLQCVHNHSYQVRVKAVSPDGASSNYSEPSILFICDREPPKIALAALPSSLHKVRSQQITLSGSFDEPHVDTLIVNDASAAIDYRSNTFSCALTLAPGDNIIEVYARDLAGNTSTDRSIITYAPITIVSLPANAQLHWNGNFAYPGSYGGTTPRSYYYAGPHKQTLRVSLPGFQDFFGIIDFSDQSCDRYVISLIPHAPSNYSRLDRITNGATGPPPVSYPHPFVVDFNLDGHKDLVVGNADGTVSLLLNRGADEDPWFLAPRALEAEDGPIDVGTNAAPFLLDYDNNGSFDLLVGTGEGYLYVYSNRGDNTVPSFSAPALITGLDGIPLNVESDCTPWVSDWNRDRRKDLLLGSGNGSLLLAINVGSDSAPVFDSMRPLHAGGRPIEAFGPSAPCVIDWNADGHPDVLMGAGDGSIHVYYAAEGSNEPELSEGSPIQSNGQPLVLEGALAPFPVDWNGDGEQELVIGRGDGGIYLLD